MKRITENVNYLWHFFCLYKQFGETMFTSTKISKLFMELIFENVPENNLEVEAFIAEGENIVQSVLRNQKECSFTYLLLPDRTLCRMCAKPLNLIKEFKTCTIYDCYNGTGIGARFKKECRRCKVTEHYGFYCHNGERIVDIKSVNSNKILLSTEETGFAIKSLDMYKYDLLHAHVSFNAKATIYNSLFQYRSGEKDSYRR